LVALPGCSGRYMHGRNYRFTSLYSRKYTTFRGKFNSFQVIYFVVFTPDISERKDGRV
jgi:hypothetical protein